MEKRIISKVDEYVQEFKKDVKEYLDDSNLNHLDYDDKSKLLKFIYDYDKLTLDKNDFAKRKRVKSVVPFYQRCMAKRANGEQCTRKKKDASCYCGTHDKNRPHGEIDKNNTETDVKLKKLEVWLQDINGVMYYIDKFNNVYNTTDIINNKVNPEVYAKYSVNDEIYSLNM